MCGPDKAWIVLSGICERYMVITAVNIDRPFILCTQHTCTHMHVRTCMHTKCTCTRGHTYTHTHTHTHTPAPQAVLCSCSITLALTGKLEFSSSTMVMATGTLFWFVTGKKVACDRLANWRGEREEGGEGNKGRQKKAFPHNYTATYKTIPYCGFLSQEKSKHQVSTQIHKLNLNTNMETFLSLLGVGLIVYSSQVTAMLSYSQNTDFVLPKADRCPTISAHYLLQVSPPSKL